MPPGRLWNTGEACVHWTQINTTTTTTDERKLALDISSRVVKFLSTSLAADSSSYIPIRAQSEHSAAPTASGPKSVSFADMVAPLSAPPRSGRTDDYWSQLKT